MTSKDDVKWWGLEAKKHPESVATIIEELARRLIELDVWAERSGLEPNKIDVVVGQTHLYVGQDSQISFQKAGRK
ncbi:MAG: hypothetical protein U9R15_12125 [Chloroflexota bacterium]|nr:hypothetical protein [Chloroflexota bacterium]